MKRIVLTNILILACTAVFAQTNGFNWLQSAGQHQRFIENKGQFDRFNADAGAPVLYAIDNGQSMVLFTRNGYTFRFAEKYKNPDRKRGQRDKARYLEQVATINVAWNGSNNSCTLEAVGATQDRNTYAMLQSDGSERQVENVKGFEKLVYHSIYPGIDVEFTFHEIEGFKYDLILHPGADVSRINMRYSEDYLPKIDENGNLVVATGFGDIVDHAPVAY